MRVPANVLEFAVLLSGPRQLRAFAPRRRGGTSVAMSSFSESEPVFAARCLKVGLAEADITKLKAQGITTLAKVAFCCSYTPGSGDDAELIRALKDALAVEPDLGQKSAFRRLYHEAFSVTTAEMKALVEQTDETAPRRLSVPERAERHTKIAKRLPGLDIRNRLEPSDSLVDACVSLYEQNRLNFIEWDRLTSKEQEATSSSKRETVLSVDASGRLKTEKGEAAKAETTTELLLQFALTRRGIALEMGNLLDFNLHAKWVDRLLCARLDQVPQTKLEGSSSRLSPTVCSWYSRVQILDRDPRPHW